MAVKKVVQWRQPGKADRSGLALRLELRQHSWNQGNATDECDQHPATGNQTQFGKALVVGRQKGEKSYGRGRGGQRERVSHLAGSPSQRFIQVRQLVPFCTITYAELNAEIHAHA